MKPDRRTVDTAIDHAADTARMYASGEVSERDVETAKRYALLALESYLEQLKRGG